jgi:hypothetical protein
MNVTSLDSFLPASDRLPLVRGFLLRIQKSPAPAGLSVVSRSGMLILVALYFDKRVDPAHQVL